MALAGGEGRKKRNDLVLIVEDEKLLRWTVKERLTGEGFKVREAADGKSARQLLEQHYFDLVLLDFKLPDTNGLEILKEIRSKNEDVPVLLMTAFSSVENAVEAMKLGAYSYLTKPFDEEELVMTIEKALETTRLRREVARLRERQSADFGLDNIVASSPLMKKVFEVAVKVACSPATTVLITGESGVGKDLLAKAIHARSDRSNKPFMNITCTTITETLLESELFGHERGAFTDAKSSKKGLFELAHGGTVFLDEIGDMPASLQAKLLRVLQEKTFRRVGGRDDVTVDVRIVAATNKDLQKLVEDGRFREDLLYRLKVLPIEIPPLRDRAEDVHYKRPFFVGRYNQQFGKAVKGLTDEAMRSLSSYGWPGNVRELKNVIERAMILGEGEWIGAEDLPFYPGGGGQAPESKAQNGDRFVLPEKGVNLEELEIDLIKQALKRTKGVKTKAGALLGLNRDQIRYRMDKHNIEYERGT